MNATAGNQLLRYACRYCGKRSATFAEQCPGCKAWDSMLSVAPTEAAGNPMAGAVRSTAALPGATVRRAPTGLPWFDKLCNGGLVLGQRLLLGGQEGAGKSTLCLQLAGAWASRGRRVLYVCGEMQPADVSALAKRIGASSRELWLTGLVGIAPLAALIRELKPGALVVDSLNSLQDNSRRGDPGSPVQMRACLAQLGRIAQGCRAPSIFLAHLNARDAISGPRWLRHEVDAVAMLRIGKDRGRTLEVDKNRAGPESTARLTMTEKGLTHG